MANDAAGGAGRPVKIFPPSSMLRARVGKPQPKPDRMMHARAALAVRELRDDYVPQMCGDLEALRQLLSEGDGDLLEHEARASALELALKIKGEAPTQGFDLVGRAAASLSKILEGKVEIAKEKVAIMRHHVAAITALANSGSSHDDVARELVEILESLAPSGHQ